MIYLLVPIAVVVVSPFGDTGFIAFPPQGLTLKWYAAALNDGRYLTGFLLSLRLASIVALISASLGMCAAYAITRYDFPGAKALEALFLSPLILPTLVMAVALTAYFTRSGLPTGTWRLVAAQSIICIPYVIRIVLPLLQRFDRSLEEAALSLGATPIRSFFLVLVPVIRPALIAGAAMAFITSFDEVVLALFLSVPGQTTLPVMIYSSVQLGFEPVVAAVAGLLVCLTGVVMVIMHFFGLRTRG
ncbi:ABC transporter permease [Tianweitania sp. BSSL-BM11]|uniref:ABC transporter permease n=1 Tax=Tianweitania aestuarii TaxID=2814886 RepID=A0ABS5RWD8_9HYPH|nr:ABC transporter permease [Tianweitania aestuarii]MBS9721388.1 ABC transporter permease [Tianweitania aestuarii]